MLSSIIYSCISNHDSKEINFYILDFGAETLTMFKDAPHVGEVMLSTDSEKINNVFKMVSGIMEERKKLLVDYNGSYDFYINHGGKQIPLICIVINNVEAFMETYPDYEELIGQMTRDCLKYGILFIFSTNGPNTVRYRLRQNFKRNVVLQFNDPMDYSSVIPGVRKKEPSKVYGRGMILLDGIYEFQTAYPYVEEKATDYIKTISSKLNDICSYRAQRIPILPEVVNRDFVKDYLSHLNTIPVGVEKETLEIATINLKDKPIYTITGEDISTETDFIKAFIHNSLVVDNTECIIMDTNSVLGNMTEERITYNNDTCQEAIDKLKNEISENNQEKTILCFIININSFFGKIGSSEKLKITDLIGTGIKNGNIKFILIDVIDGIKAINFETWFKSGADLSEGIWLGNGIANQFTLKVTTNSRLLRAEVSPGFGYVIKKGKASLMKLMSDE